MHYVHTQSSISVPLAERMMTLIIEKAAELGNAISLTILDESGNINTFNRMDNAPQISIDLSRKKTVKAIGMGISSGNEWYDHVKNDPILTHGVQGSKDFIFLGGRSPILKNKAVIESKGVSGSHYRHYAQCVKNAFSLADL
ncbi:MAG: heme-binding protein [Ignavibacteriales bacterium]|nr:heme-binding protein [Ignavibacteriales bacterium]